MKTICASPRSLYLFIGLFIFVRRWNAPRAVHFYIFCLVSFVLYSFHYTGKLNSFDWNIYWGNVVALLLQPALLVHFALVFPERRGKLWPKLLAVYSAAGASVAASYLHRHRHAGFPALHRNAHLARQMELAYLGMLFLVAAGIFLASYFRAPSGVLRQQLKWVTGGTFAGILPFRCSTLCRSSSAWCPPPWMKFSVFSLALIPLCFGYAIIRYRLMDVDIIFKRGLAYTFATAAVVGDIFRRDRTDRRTVPHRVASTVPRAASSPSSSPRFSFEPLRDWVQARLDHFFYRDRLDYRRTLIEFGRALTNEVRLEPILGSVLDRISQTLLVDRLAIFLEDAADPGRFVLSRSMGCASRRRRSILVSSTRPPGSSRAVPVFRIAARRARRK